MAPYPHDLERVVTLKDGVRVSIRPIRADDQARLIELYDRLSQHTAYQRFFTVMRRMPPDWAKILATVDYRRRLALVAENQGPTGVELVGVGRYEPTAREDTAEVAFVVQDGWQNRGLGTILFQGVLEAAQARGVARFVAFVLADNTRMLDLIQRFTDIRQRTVQQGVVEVVFTPRSA
jgi:L-amino acid N-acyltransferase YncA